MHTHCAAPWQGQGPFEEGNEELLIKDQTVMHKQKDGERERSLAFSKPHGQGLLLATTAPSHIAFHTEHALNLQGWVTYLPQEKMLCYTMVLFVGRKEVGRQY